MSMLSIRTLPKELAKAVSREAHRQGKTKTKIVIEALEAAFHLEKKTKRSAKIRKFFGKMTVKEFEAFQKATSEFSRIDSEMWR